MLYNNFCHWWTRHLKILWDPHYPVEWFGTNNGCSKILHLLHPHISSMIKSIHSLNTKILPFIYLCNAKKIFVDAETPKNSLLTEVIQYISESSNFVPHRKVQHLRISFTNVSHQINRISTQDSYIFPKWIHLEKMCKSCVNLLHNPLSVATNLHWCEKTR